MRRTGDCMTFSRWTGALLLACATGMALQADARAQVWDPLPPQAQVDDFIDVQESLSVDLFGANYVDPGFIFYLLDGSAQEEGTYGANYLGHACAIDVAYVNPCDPEVVLAAMSSDLAAAQALASLIHLSGSFVSGRMFAAGTAEFNVTAAAVDLDWPGLGTVHALVVMQRLSAPYELEPSASFAASMTSSAPCADPNNPHKADPYSTNPNDYPCSQPQGSDLQDFCKLCTEVPGQYEMTKVCQNGCCTTYRNALTAAAQNYNATTSNAWAARIESINNANGNAAGGVVGSTGVGVGCCLAGPVGWIVGGILFLGGTVTSVVLAGNAQDSANENYCTKVANAKETYDRDVQAAVDAFLQCMCECCTKVNKDDDDHEGH